jgi:phosphoribosylformylglycinamidine cyclo-ligase
MSSQPLSYLWQNYQGVTVTTPDGPKDLYKDSGVDVAKGERLVDWLKEDDENNKSVVSGIGGFAGLFRPDFKGMDDPILVSGTDGVGTKILLGIEENDVFGLGIDLVAMCVNDLYTIGAKPLFFIDYFATGTLDEKQFKDAIRGIQAACKSCGAALLGGETAEMPGLYSKGHFDMAGFVVGVVDGPKRLGPEKVNIGDKLYAIKSTGFHSNGFSLVRKWLKDNKDQTTPIKRLLTPTQIYSEIPPLLAELGEGVVNAIANITGGGISGNLPRVMPKDVECQIDFGSLPVQDWVKKFVSDNNSNLKEVEPVFNLGAGMIASINEDKTSEFEIAAKKAGLVINEIGTVKSGNGDPVVNYV